LKLAKQKSINNKAGKCDFKNFIVEVLCFLKWIIKQFTSFNFSQKSYFTSKHGFFKSLFPAKK
jgi:hypothetical protein